MTECFEKPTWSIRDALRELASLPPHLMRVSLTGAGVPITAALRERIMLAVAAENQCVYCQLAHSAIGQSVGLRPEETAAILAGGDGGSGDAGEVAALAFARDLARRDFQDRDEGLWAALADHFTDRQREAIQSAARVMNFANRFGNTFDAARARLTSGCLPSGLGDLDLAVVSAAFLSVAAAVSPLVGWLMVRQRIP